MTREELIAALEKATGPSFALDQALGEWRYDLWGAVSPAVHKSYTASIDAALALVPGGCNAIIHTAGGAAVFTPTLGLHDHDMTYAATPAIALCIAALKARATS